MDNLIKEIEEGIEKEYANLWVGRTIEFRSYSDPKIPTVWVLWEGEWTPQVELFDKYIKPLQEEKERMIRFRDNIPL